MAAVVLANRQGGPVGVPDPVEARAPDGFSNLEEVISRQELQAIVDAYKQLTGADRDALNRRPSWSVR